MNKKVLAVVVALIVVVAIVLAYFWFFAPRVVSKNSYNVVSCTDSDGRDIYARGESVVERYEPGESNWYNIPDTCVLYSRAGKVGTLLRESWCEGNEYNEILTTCGYGSQCVADRCSK